MDDDVASAINRIHEEYNRHLAIIISTQAHLSAVEHAFLKVCQQSGTASLEGVPVQQWISRQYVRDLQESLLAMDNEQVAALVQQFLQKAMDEQKFEP